MTPSRLRVATRSSRLALWQTRFVRTRLEERWPGLVVEPVEIRTLGDRVTDVPLPRIGDKGLFTRELEDGLHEHRVDVAVHSLKDLPTAMPDGLRLAAVLEREDPRDAVVSRNGLSLAALAPGARVGTSSLRRRAQLAAWRGDLSISDLRGNVPTRVEQVLNGGYDAAVLAHAGLKRLDLTAHVTELLEPEVMLSAPGQGAVAIQIRDGDEEVRALVTPLDHERTHLATSAERAMLGTLEGGCHVPVAALARWTGPGLLGLEGLVAAVDGRRVVRAACEAAVRTEADARRLGEALAAELLARGAGEILASLPPLQVTRAWREQGQPR